ncbi:heavy metal-binding domain-containing protein [Pedobacter sp. Du54]|uniref:heavy metal-binding domain-containing protein n=1 Tax=Pedobacter anseongensis TaxID=3133439 RepID=UPI0030951FB2
MELKTCPNCGDKLNGLMSTKIIVDDKTRDFINLFIENKSEAYCSGCAPKSIGKFVSNAIEEKDALVKELQLLIRIVPIITAHSPLNWDYEVIEMVSSQSVAGTGLFTELSSSWADFLGTQSNSLNAKLSGGELNCKNQLRYKAAMLGGNGIIPTDIEYAEVGGAKAMLMVCMAGTAVRIKNQDEVFKNNAVNFIRINEIIKRIGFLNNLKYTSY